MAGFAQPVVLDATVLSNVASSGSVEWLLDLVERPVVVQTVRDELERGRAHGHRFLDNAIERMGDDLPLVTAEHGEQPSRVANVRARLDPGEAE
jgi:predicted nucleic acid-binding protein